jgi:hypothetical protein
MESASLRVAAILFLAVFTIEFGGLSLLRMIQLRDPGYMENPVRRKLFRAGHAHAASGSSSRCWGSSTSTKRI